MTDFFLFSYKWILHLAKKAKTLRRDSTSASQMAHFFAIFILSLAVTCCKAQQADSVQIVARAALCFDNQTVNNNCLRSMRRISNGVGMQNSTIGFCNGPCFGQTMLMLSCIDGILSNFQFYSPGMLQGVQSVFQMSCGGRTNNNNNNNDTNNSTSGNMVAQAKEERPKPLIARDLAALWMLLLAIVLVVALISCVSSRQL
ncbi:hypothetical protein HPP92_001815 [Vanilla planifolia]|uniref:DUF7731 domain-containing protein n=1 Tax=Vanilla planifolia TaxID=51239 RepID=A0A835VLX1_VANPL|nr:hypothetical protein HPP92_002049 [Vanilla planifolia]KAG0501743.1 hypothetical protein HPP92_001815 [Vanilla planifolia]